LKKITARNEVGDAQVFFVEPDTQLSFKEDRVSGPLV
jgi:hypothetical protein